MNKILYKLKGVLGFCQCEKCWNKSGATMTIKPIGKTMEICDKHMAQALYGAELTGITVKE